MIGVKVKVRYLRATVTHPGSYFPIGVNEILLETGAPDHLLQENGDRIILDE